MVYRSVCNKCTAFIKSEDTRRYGDLRDFWQDWEHQTELWHSHHVCGNNDGDGIENERMFRQYTE